MNPPEWSIEDEAILRAYNYAVDKYDICKDLLNEDGLEVISLEVMLKQAYQQGFLNGFGHKFDNTNYEEK